MNRYIGSGTSDYYIGGESVKYDTVASDPVDIDCKFVREVYKKILEKYPNTRIAIQQKPKLKLVWRKVIPFLTKQRIYQYDLFFKTSGGAYSVLATRCSSEEAMAYLYGYLDGLDDIEKRVMDAI